MKYTIFSKLSIDNQSDKISVDQLQKYQQLAAQFNQRYQLIRPAISLIDDKEKAKEVSFAFSEYNSNFSEINQEVNKYLTEKEQNLNKALSLIKKYDNIFNEIEPIYQANKELILDTSTALGQIHRELQQEQKQYINSLNAQWSTLQSQLKDQIDKGIESLLEVKLTLGITGSFKEQIEKEIDFNKRSEIIYFVLFILTLVLIPVSISGVYFVEELKSLPWEDLLLIKASIALPLIWIARWFSKNYAHARLALIKFDHLNRLLGEGANTIAKLVEADSEAKSEVYKRFAELFLDIKDLENISLKQPKHPIEDVKDIIDITKNWKQ